MWDVHIYAVIWKKDEKGYFKGLKFTEYLLLNMYVFHAYIILIPYKLFTVITQ